jgi:hypothetical protein
LLEKYTKPNQVNGYHPYSSSHQGEESQRSPLLGGITKTNQTKSLLAIPALLLTEER